MKNKKGFTLIELLAVIIILGILMIIAIPSVTKYISDSRKSSYVDTAKEIIAGARNKVNEGKLGMYDTNATYYIPVDYIKTENAQKSPYGDFVQAYVVVTYNGQGYSYYWISVDDAGQGVKEIVSYDKLDTDNIESDIVPSEIESYVKTTVVGNRNTVKILNTEREEWITPVEPIANHVPEEGAGSENGVVVYPAGKTKATVEVGDIVTIDTEEFYVVKHDGSDLVLLSHYNLNVGSNKKPGSTEGIQDSAVKGYVSGGTAYGTVAFSSSGYWNWNVGEGKTYPGSYCSSNTYSAGTTCAYVYDENCILKPYVDTYKTYLEGKGATIKSARLLRVEEAFELGCGKGQSSCSAYPTNAPSWIYETSYWLGSVGSSRVVWQIKTSGDFSGYDYGYGNYDNSSSCGVRPVIVI